MATYCYSSPDPGERHSRTRSDAESIYRATQQRLSLQAQQANLKNQQKIIKVRNQIEKKIKKIEESFLSNISAEEKMKTFLGNVDQRTSERLKEIEDVFEGNRSLYIEGLLIQTELNEYINGLESIVIEVDKARDEIDQAVRDVEIRNSEEKVYGHYLNYHQKAMDFEIKLYSQTEGFMKELSNKIESRVIESAMNSFTLLEKEIITASTTVDLTLESDIHHSEELTPEIIAKKIFLAGLSQKEKDIVKENDHLEIDHKEEVSFKTDDTTFKKSLESNWKRGIQSKPQSKQQSMAKRLGLNLLIDADSLKVKGLNKSAIEILGYSDKLIDFATGVIPITSVPRDFYELMYGEDLFSGKKLSQMERSLNLLGVISLGASKLAKAGLLGTWNVLKSLRKTSSFLSKSETVSHVNNLGDVYTKASSIVDSARKLGLKTKETLTNYAQLAKRLSGNNIGAIGDIEQVARTASKTKQGIPILFDANNAVGHFSKHSKQVMKSFGKDTYNLKEYMLDANHVIKNGQFVPELNGYVKIIGSAGNRGKAHAAFVGMKSGGKNISTFHMKSVSEIARKAPSLGWD